MPEQSHSTETTLSTLPPEGWVRQPQVIGRPARQATESKPARSREPGIVPFSSATLWRKVKDGTFPAPVKLSDRITAWSVQSLREWMQSHSERTVGNGK